FCGAGARGSDCAKALTAVAEASASVAAENTNRRMAVSLRYFENASPQAGVRQCAQSQSFQRGHNSVTCAYKLPARPSPEGRFDRSFAGSRAAFGRAHVDLEA